MFTLAMLKTLSPCKEQLELFIQLFGNEASITLENFELAVANGLDINWFVESYTNFSSQHLEQYKTVSSQALEQFDTVRDKAWEQYKPVDNEDYKQFDTVSYEAWERYQTIKRSAQFTLLQQTFGND